ncbi:MAG TPA: PilZ domain-containing protein [Polyangia bacterium]|nr:PilZ domain-containing protein [Polyangia bacterium]
MTAHPRDRRASRRNPIQVRLEMSDTRGSFTGRSVDVSRGGIFAATSETRPVGTLLRVRVLGPRGDAVMAVGVIVRCFSDLEASGEGGGVSPGLAIALTSTSEAWDRFWDDVSATQEFDDEEEDFDDEDAEAEDEEDAR